jgi:hypothetical protein
MKTFFQTILIKIQALFSKIKALFNKKYRETLKELEDLVKEELK